MDTQKLRKTLKMVKEASTLSYAIYNTDKYGDCSSCVSSEIAQTFGDNATGIYLKLREAEPLMVLTLKKSQTLLHLFSQ